MYKCKNCGRVFEKPIKIVLQNLEHFGLPCSETGYVCPNCKESNYQEAYKCEICGDYDFDEKYCGNCKTKTINQLKMLIDLHFTEKEIDLICEYIDEVF